MGSWDLQVPEPFTFKYPPSWLTACGYKQSFVVPACSPSAAERVGGGDKGSRKCDFRRL